MFDFPAVQHSKIFLVLYNLLSHKVQLREIFKNNVDEIGHFDDGSVTSEREVERD